MRDDPLRHTRYRGTWFSAACSLRLDAGLGHPRRLAGLLAAAMLRPRQFAALIALLLTTPSERVPLTNSAAGRALARYFDERFLRVFPRNRLCRGVLLLPSDHSAYLRGRQRQALRTNLRHAATLGIRCESIDDQFSAIEALGEIVDNRRLARPGDRARLTAWWQSVFASPEVTFLVARHHCGRPLALTAVVVDSTICLIQMAAASSHEARWALHDHLVRMLIGRHVKYLFAEGDGPFGALGYKDDVHHFQHLLGYELRHLIPRRTAAPVGGH
jgi:hypothetical protein